MKATFAAQIGDAPTAIRCVEEAINGDVRYHARAALDRALAPIRPALNELLDKMLVTARTDVDLCFRQAEHTTWGALEDKRENVQMILHQMKNARTYSDCG